MASKDIIGQRLEKTRFLGRFKPACSATESWKNPEISNVACLAVVFENVNNKDVEQSVHICKLTKNSFLMACNMNQ